MDTHLKNQLLEAESGSKNHEKEMFQMFADGFWKSWARKEDGVLNQDLSKHCVVYLGL